MARETYDHKDIEQKAQAKWAELNLYEVDLTDTEKEKYYLLFEFPYPSGDLHIGHWYAFALTDIYARKLRMAGKNVLFPMGFDAFGLPAENAAIKNNVDPKKWTYENMERMRAQVRTMGASMDWSKEVVTCDPSYYKWTQWLFTKFLEHGLAERRLAPVKWCPKDQTVLANEQVNDGKCERCGSEVEEKNLTQWFLKITNYAERLLKDLDGLDWPNEIKEAQRAWIGESEGAHLSFRILGTDEVISVFTTRPDTVFGATYVVLAPEHPMVATLLPRLNNSKEVETYRNVTSRKTERERQENKEKTGVRLEGVTAVNPATNEEIPVYIADYVLASYGTGAVMAVPAHDERDHEFAQKMSLPIVQVIESDEELYLGDGTLVESGDFTGRNSREALWDIVSFVKGERTKNYRIRDWSVGRQRYWGCPIPVVYDPDGNVQPIPSEHLPWLLPEDVDFTPGAAGAGNSPLASSKELQERVTRIFGEGWTPEYDTLDTFVDSSWYFMRYLDAEDTHDFTDQALMKKWMPVDRYSGGSEHTTMHLLYARFFTKVLHDLALCPVDEPFKQRFNRGIILGPDGAKMSKSKGNVVSPDEVVGTFGADAVRMYLAFIGPYNEPGHYPWNLDGTLAMRRFLDRIFKISEKSVEEEASQEVKRAIALAIQKVGTDIDRFKFNTAISSLMILVRDLENLKGVPKEALRTLVILLAPFAPHLAEHLWEKLGQEGSVHAAEWPEADSSLLTTSEVVLAVQVNGKKRGEVTLAPDASEAEALHAAIQIESVKTSLGKMRPSRVIYVPGRILNLVV
jgi:leucyl-tRNA synthetase